MAIYNRTRLIGCPTVWSDSWIVEWSNSWIVRWFDRMKIIEKKYRGSVMYRILGYPITYAIVKMVWHFLSGHK